MTNLNTLDDLIKSPTSPKGFVRPIWDWYASVVLQSELSFELLLFRSENPNRTSGNCYHFSWNPERKCMAFVDMQNTLTPELQDGVLSIQLPNVSLLWFRGDGFCTLSEALIEAFLDDWYRNEIFTRLASHRSTEVLKWLSKHGIKVYRKLHDPRQRQDVAVEVVFPPDMDFLKGCD